MHLLHQLFPDKVELNQKLVGTNDTKLKSKEVINMMKKAEFHFFLFPKAITEVEENEFFLNLKLIIFFFFFKNLKTG